MKIRRSARSMCLTYKELAVKCTIMHVVHFMKSKIKSLHPAPLRYKVGPNLSRLPCRTAINWPNSLMHSHVEYAWMPLLIMYFFHVVMLLRVEHVPSVVKLARYAEVSLMNLDMCLYQL